MDNDDKPVGQILSRRDVLKILGFGSAATFLVACAPEAVETLSTTTEVVPATEAILQEVTSVANIPVCVVRPELTEGPFFVDEMLNRSDIRTESSDGSIVEGVQLDVIFNVTQVNSNGCVVLPSAQVDIWHCDANGVYSGVQDGTNDTTNKTFLRGYQITDANGIVKFTTIYPGWYPGRTVHIHFKIRVDNYEFTSQLFFDDAISDQVFSQVPYKDGNRTLNSQDGIYSQNGNLLTANVTQNESGYLATFDIGLQI